jgi:uncharacterized phosphosugar-binding protein
MIDVMSASTPEPATTRWLEAARSVLDHVATTQMSAIDAAAEVFADAIANDGLVHMFGSGHSRMGAEEMFPRIGSFPGFHPIAELALTNHIGTVGPNGLRQVLFLEKVEGFARVILQQIKLHRGDAFLVLSSSGVGGVALELALYVKAMGLPLVAITSIDHARSVPSSHPSGLKLMGLADVVVDNGSLAGDAAVEIDGLAHRVGPTSTIGAIAAVNAIKVATAEKLVGRGTPPVVLSSHHAGDRQAGEDQLEAVYEEYFRRIRRAYDPVGALEVPEPAALVRRFPPVQPGA